MADGTLRPVGQSEEGVDITIALSTRGKNMKGSSITESFYNQPLEKIQAIEKLFETEIRPKVYKILRG